VEAQHGDLANVAQPMIDQFVVSGRPGGLRGARLASAARLREGQGPEHSRRA